MMGLQIATVAVMRLTFSVCARSFLLLRDWDLGV
jgi:hypothetical protein